MRRRSLIFAGHQRPDVVPAVLSDAPVSEKGARQKIVSNSVARTLLYDDDIVCG